MKNYFYVTMFLPSRYSFRLTSKKRLAKEQLKQETIVAAALEETPENDRKRSFLKLAGLAGLGIVASQVVPKKASAYILGSTPSASVVGVKNAANTRIDPAQETGGNLATIATNTTKIGSLSFDGSNNLYVQAASSFTSQLENASNVVINPATEDSLVAIKTQTNQLTFSSGALVTTSSGGGASVVGIKDTTSTQVNPATDDSIVYLRRIVKLMESQATVDGANRQRISLDASTATVTVSGTVTSTVSNATLAAGAALIGGVTIDGQGRQMFTEIARQAYNSGIRSNLSFS